MKTINYDRCIGACLLVGAISFAATSQIDAMVVVSWISIIFAFIFTAANMRKYKTENRRKLPTYQSSNQ